MARRFTRLYIAAFFVCLSFTAPAGDYFVSHLGSDSNAGTFDKPWRTLKKAFESMNPNTSVRHNLYVAAGIYEENFSFMSMVNVRGGYNPQTWDRNTVWHATFLRKPDGGPLILKNKMLLDGFIIHGGLSCNGVSPAINDCHITMSLADGISCEYGSSPVITNSSIRQCRGRGINIYSESSPQISTSVIAMNGGDGIRCGGKSNPRLVNVTVAHNIGAGIRAELQSDPYIDNSIIWDNEPDLVNCHTWHSCVSDGDTNPGNMTDNPLFFGWGGYNEFQPIYISPNGTETNPGTSEKPMKYFRQAMNVFSYHLTNVSPCLKRGSDLRNLGAYPDQTETLPYLGNAARVMVLPGTYNESGIVVTVPTNFDGFTGYITALQAGGRDAFLWKTTGRLTTVNIAYARTAFIQTGGYLLLSDSIVSGSTYTGIDSMNSDLELASITVRDSAGDGVFLSNTLCRVKSGVMASNSQSGIRAEGASVLWISGADINWNSTGLMLMNHTMADIRNCDIHHNVLYGLFAVGSSDVKVQMSRFFENYIAFLSNESSRTATHSSLFYDNWNTAFKIGIQSDCSIINNTIFSNIAGIQAFDATTPLIRNCIVRGNKGRDLEGCQAEWSNVEAHSGGTGNMDGDPLFTDAAARDFRLLAGSPCIDAGLSDGITFRDYEGNYRLQGGDVDMGAFESSGASGFTFTRNAQGWFPVSVPAVFTPPLFEHREGVLSLRSQENKNSYGLWSSPPGAGITQSGALHRIRFRVRGLGSSTALAPLVRLRTGAMDTQWVDELDVSSPGDGAFSPGITSRDYDYYLVPPARLDPAVPEDADLSFAFDMVNMDPNDAGDYEFLLEHLQVSSVSLSSIETYTLEKRYEFANNADGWVSGGADLVYNLPDMFWENGALIMESENNWKCFGYWERLATETILKPNRIYRVNFVVRAGVPQALCPTLRFRVSSEDYAVSWVRMLNSKSDASVLPRNTDTTFSMYFIPPPVYTGATLNHPRLACDLINMNEEDDSDAIIAIERVDIHSAPIPAFP